MDKSTNENNNIFIGVMIKIFTSMPASAINFSNIRKIKLITYDTFLRYFASGLFLLSHSLLVLDHLSVGTALHGIGEVFFAPWAIKQKAWDLVIIAFLFGVFDLWGTLKLGLN
tara:strand:- start:212 stop:550 length:339 start_codon:yes stop_codon:yes gene_type:complete